MKNKKKEHLDLLISSNEEIKKRGGLSQKGIDHLEGMKCARNIIFPNNVNKKR